VLKHFKARCITLHPHHVIELLGKAQNVAAHARRQINHAGLKKRRRRRRMGRTPSVVVVAATADNPWQGEAVACDVVGRDLFSMKNVDETAR
jgi:hypothetical protein